jgi:hypothetical protein
LGAGAAAVATATGSLGTVTSALAADRVAKGEKVAPAETTVARFYRSLTAEQKAVAALPFTDERVTRANANWQVIKPTIGELYSQEQQRMIHEILRGVLSEEGYDRMLRQTLDDAGGIEKYACAVFGEPGNGKYAWLLTGRHLTARADGNSSDNFAFGGPIIYGHQVAGNLKANLYHYQTEAANEVFKALDGKQREKALLEKAPAESDIALRKAGFAGIAAGELSKDQRRLLEQVMHQLLAPYREEDVKEAIAGVKANGGLDKIHLSFYKNDDLGNDQEWDIWRLEGPTLVWHFRGAPHVHTWVNFRTRPA